MPLARASRLLASMHADHRRIVRGLLLGGAFVLLGRLAGAAKEILIAWRYGVSGTVDAYQLALMLVGWAPGTLIAMSATILVPVLVRARAGGGQGLTRFLGELNALAIAAGAGLALVGVFAWPFMVELLAGGLSETTRRMAVDMSYRLLPISVLALLAAVFAARLQARERHVNTLLEALPALTLVVVLLAWPAGIDSGPLVWGTLFGMAVHAVVLGRLAAGADGGFGPLRLGAASPYWSDIWKAAQVLFIGQLAMSFIEPIDQFTAARLGDSAIATLGYANRVLALMLSMGALAIARATLPTFADALARGDTARAQRQARGWAWVMVTVGAVAAGIAWLLAPWLVGLLFERGAFTAEDTVAVAQVVRWGLLQLPFYFGSILFVQLLAAMGRFGIIGMVAFPNMAIKLALNGLAVQWVGLGGVLLATGIMYLFSFAFFLVALHRLKVRAGRSA